MIPSCWPTRIQYVFLNMTTISLLVASLTARSSLAQEPFFVPATGVTWQEAQDGCVDLGSTLLTLSQTQNGMSCWSDVTSKERVWIGGFFDHISQQWLWDEDWSVVDLEAHDITPLDYPEGEFFKSGNAFVGSGAGLVSMQRGRITYNIVGYCCNAGLARFCNDRAPL